MGVRTAAAHVMKRAGAMIAVLGICAILLYPHPILVAPAWTIRVVDQNNRPVSGCVVQENWQHYYVDFTMHQTVLTTGADGVATFPAQSLRMNWFMMQTRKAGSQMSFHGGRFAPLVSAYACLHQPGMTQSGQIDYKGEAVTQVVVTRR